MRGTYPNTDLSHLRAVVMTQLALLNFPPRYKKPVKNGQNHFKLLIEPIHKQIDFRSQLIDILIDRHYMYHMNV